VCCGVLQCVAVCCSVLQCVAVCCSIMQCVVVWCSVMQCVAVWCMCGVSHSFTVTCFLLWLRQDSFRREYDLTPQISELPMLSLFVAFHNFLYISTHTSAHKHTHTHTLAHTRTPTYTPAIIIIICCLSHLLSLKSTLISVAFLFSYISMCIS